MKAFFDVLEASGLFGCRCVRYECDIDDVSFLKEQLLGERIEEDADYE